MIIFNLKNKNMRLLLSLLGIFLLSINLSGQGSYLPANADASFPRTLMDREDLDNVRTNIGSTEVKRQLYSNIYGKALEAIPSGNETRQERQTRALIAREAAFVYLINRKIADNQLVVLDPIERQDFADKAILLLESMNRTVEVIDGFSFYFNWQFRTNELSLYLVAYDLLRGADISAESLSTGAGNLQMFAGAFYEKTIQLYPFPNVPGVGLEFYSYNPNNHGVMYSSTLGLAGIVLGDLTSDDPIYQPTSWINAGMWSLDHTLWEATGAIPRVAERGVLSGYAESPNYFWYGFKNAFPFLRAMWNFLPDGSYDYTFRVYPNPIFGNGNPQTATRSIRHPWYDPDYYNLYEWVKRIRMPNGNLPAIHDSATHFNTEFTSLTGQATYHLPVNDGAFNSIWIRTQYLCTPVEVGSYDIPLFQAMPAAGDLIFRNTYNDPSGTYMHFIGKNGIALYGAKAHHQADATSYQLYYNNETMLLDPGYPGAPQRLAVAGATSHNLVLVNGEGPSLVNGEFVNQDNEVFIENYFDRPSLDYGELRGGWQGAGIVRKNMFVHDRFYIVSDFLRSSSPKEYTFQVHGNGLENADVNSAEGNLTTDFQTNKYTYTRNTDTKVISLTTARGGVNEFTTQLDSAAISGFRYHTKVLANKNNVNNTEFLTIHYPFLADTEPTLSEVPTSNSLVSAVNIKDDFYDNLVFTNAANYGMEVSFPITEILTVANGNLNIISLDEENEFKLGFTENGDSLLVDNKPVFISENKGDLYLEKITVDTFMGYVGQAGTVRFYNDIQLVPQDGAVDNFIFDEENGYTTISFSDQGDFTLVADSLFTSLPTIDVLSDISVIPNPSNGIFNLNIGEVFLSEISFTITNAAGQIIKQNEKVLAPELQINLSSFSSGVYFINLKSDKENKTLKLIKE